MARRDILPAIGTFSGVDNLDLSLNAFNLMAGNPTFWTATQGVTLAFIIGTVLALTYISTFEGLSYSKSFIQSLVLSPIVSAIAMMAIDGSLARGIGMMGAFSILRFRSNLKDPFCKSLPGNCLRSISFRCDDHWVSLFLYRDCNFIEDSIYSNHPI